MLLKLPSTEYFHIYAIDHTLPVPRPVALRENFNNAFCLRGCFLVLTNTNIQGSKQLQNDFIINISLWLCGYYMAYAQPYLLRKMNSAENLINRKTSQLVPTGSVVSIFNVLFICSWLNMSNRSVVEYLIVQFHSSQKRSTRGKFSSVRISS